MNLITSFPRYSDGEINKALMRELTTGLQLKKAWEERREIEAAEQAKAMREHKEIPGLGKNVATIPEWEYFRLVQKYGFQEVNSKSFLKYFQKNYPHLSPNKI